MAYSDVVGAKALTTPMFNNESNFLNDFNEPTLEMVDWYYRTSTTKTVHMRRIDENTSVIENTTPSSMRTHMRARYP